MYANPSAEQIEPEPLRSLQMKRLQDTVERAAAKSPFYQHLWQQRGICPQDITSLADLRKLPFTTFEDIAGNLAMDFLTMPLSSILRIGWVDSPQEFVRFYSDGDVIRNVEMMTRALASTGISRASVVAVMGDFSQSIFLDIQYALEALGAAVVPVGADYNRVIRMLDITGADTLIGEPRVLLQLVIHVQAKGRDLIGFPLQRIVCLNSSLQNPLRRHVERRTATEVYDLWVSSVFGSAGMFYQCEEHSGQHVQEDHIYPELVAFGSDEVIEDKRMGELVLTTLTAEAMPILRYRTGQSAMYSDKVCSCGRTLRRIITPFGQDL